MSRPHFNQTFKEVLCGTSAFFAGSPGRLLAIVCPIVAQKREMTVK